MKIIHKYTVGAESLSVEMPRDARILHVGSQGESIRLWALVETDNLNELRHFRVYPTGRALPADFNEDRPHLAEHGDKYLGTAHCGPFVWHVFERNA